jgi:DNA-binding response OmpR family regulator
MEKRILVIENDKGIRELISTLLAEAGYLVYLIGTEDDAFEEIKNFKPDAILLDVVQSTEKGTELCRAIKENENTGHIPVIVLSTNVQVTETIKEVCADEVMPKPFDVDELMNAIKTQLPD